MHRLSACGSKEVVVRPDLGPYRQATQQWWHKLSPLNQLRIIVVGVSVIIVMLIALALLPAYRYYEQSKAQFESEQALTAWVNAVEPRLADRRTSGMVSKPMHKSLLSLITEISQQHNIPIERVEPKEDSVSIWVDDVGFNHLIEMLFYLRKQNAIDVVEAQLSASGSPSVVSGRLVLR